MTSQTREERTMLTRETLEMWKSQGRNDRRCRAAIFPSEWDALCDLALRALQEQPRSTEGETPTQEVEALDKEMNLQWSTPGTVCYEKMRLLARSLALRLDAALARIAEYERR